MELKRLCLVSFKNSAFEANEWPVLGSAPLFLGNRAGIL